MLTPHSSYLKRVCRSTNAFCTDPMGRLRLAGGKKKLAAFVENSSKTLFGV
jgi:hypothetical protein